MHVFFCTSLMVRSSISNFFSIFIIKQEHPDLSKADKKRLCRILDCQKLSPEVRAHAVKNERLPLRIVVQVLFFEQERGSNSKAAATSHRLPDQLELFSSSGKQTSTTSRSEDHAAGKLRLGADDEKLSRGANATGKKDIYQQKKTSQGKLGGEFMAETRVVDRGEIQQVEIRELGISAGRSKLDAHKMIQRRSRSDHGRDKAKDR